MNHIFSIKDFKEITNNLNYGQVGIFPTDTIYGLGGRADKLSVIKKVHILKRRDKKKPLLILVSSLTMAKKYVKINKKQQNFLCEYWPPYVKALGGKPGALTAVLESKDVLPKELTGGTGKIGVRLPDNKFLIKIIRDIGVPLIATSANLSGEPIALDAKDIKIKADFIVDNGKLLNSKESTVVDLTGSRVVVLREGAVVVEEFKSLPVSRQVYKVKKS